VLQAIHTEHFITILPTSLHKIQRVVLLTNAVYMLGIIPYLKYLWLYHKILIQI